MKKYLAHIFFILFFYLNCFSQSILDGLNQSLEISKVADLDNIYDINLLETSKININQMDVNTLKYIPFLNTFHIFNLLNYIKKSGQVLSIYELPNIKGFDRKLIEKIIPYISFENMKEVFSYGDILRGNSNLIFRYKNNLLPKQNNYKGAMDSFYFRYVYSSNLFGVSILGEKDYGEYFGGDYNLYAFDHYSFSLFLKKLYQIDLILLGAYRANFGQGLVISSNYFYFRSDEIIKVINLNNSIKPYLGRSEYSFFNGIATAFSIKENLKLNIFYSDMFVDANIKNGYITSINNNGYHRTNNEINKKYNSTKKDIAYSIRYDNEQLEIGFNLLNTYFDKKIKLNDYLNLDSRYNLLGSVDYLFNSGNFMLFGENAITDVYKFAYLNGIYFNLETIEFIVKHTYLDKQFISLYKNQGDKYHNSINTSFKFKIIENLEINLSYDIFNSDVGSINSSPFAANELLISFKLFFDEKITFYSYFYDNFKQQKTGILKTDHSYIYNLNNYVIYNITDDISTKVYLKNVFYEKENGLLIYNDIKWSKEDIYIYFRYSFFDVSSWDARIYTYENDLKYEFYNPVFYDKGLNFVALSKFKILDFVKFSSKIYYTHFFDKSKKDKCEVKFLMEIDF